jgi:chitin-binding protein
MPSPVLDVVGRTRDDPQWRHLHARHLDPTVRTPASKAIFPVTRLRIPFFTYYQTAAHGLLHARGSRVADAAVRPQLLPRFATRRHFVQRKAISMFARSGTAIAVSVTAVLAYVMMAASPAQAHGATGAPVSRALECGPLGAAAAKSAACKAADAASGGPTAFADWDNLRVANVNGQDRQKIPDGKLCSGGIASFKGLDLPRSDWPTTNLTAGAAFSFQYRVTIPHQGSFRLYVTKAGYSPLRPLRWADLEPTPFATATDPRIQNGSYLIKATLPVASTGRHLIYTIWRTTSTPDTYYSCSDVVFTGGTSLAGAASATSSPPPAPTQNGSPTAVAPSAVQVAATSRTSSIGLPLAALAGTVVLIGGVLAVAARRRRTAARSRPHLDGPPRRHRR